MDIFHSALEIHQEHLHFELWRVLAIFFIDLIPQRSQLLGMDARFLRRVLGKVFTEDLLISAAVTMVQDHHLVNPVEVNGQAEFVPERFVPFWKLVGDGAERGSRQYDVVILLVAQTTLLTALAENISRLTTVVLEIERRGRDSERAIRKILGEP